MTTWRVAEEPELDVPAVVGGVLLRSATAADARGLARVLADSDTTGMQTARRVVPAGGAGLSRYLVGWKRAGDYGVMAMDPSGAVAGAAWARVFTPYEPGDAFIAAGVPEMKFGTRSAWRGRGIGRALTRSMIDRTRAAGHTRLSLAVDSQSTAHVLLLREGFRVVREQEGRSILLRVIDERGSGG
ncbi:GNAT family N-acetyltransferase [Microbacterium sp. NPDC057659]|uniref:GNAT family N-acetyltransferase n=1 Tax=Microbacterium sp. NPDC057659 TaxID=3346198 RepID=UPI00366C7991